MVTGVIQAGSSLGILVPPSVVLVLYAMIARQPVGQLWLAGAIPGLMMAGMFIVYIYIRCKINPELGPALEPEKLKKYDHISENPLRINLIAVGTFIALFVLLRFNVIEYETAGGVTFFAIISIIIFWKQPFSYKEIFMKEKYRLLFSGMLPLVIFFAMMIPFIKGYTSLVESSAIGAMTAFIAAVLKGRMTREVFENSVRNTLAISCMFMLIVLAALGFGAVFDGLGAVKAIDNLFRAQMGLSPWTILILMQLSFIIMGTFLDDTAMLVIVRFMCRWSKCWASI